MAMIAIGAIAWFGVFSLGTLPSVWGHFFIDGLTTEGKGSSMYEPWADEYEDYPARIERRFDDNWPVWDVEGEDGDDLRCNRYNDGAADDRPAASVRSVKAGEDITLRWSSHEDYDTSHMGPLITYLAHCDDDDCTTFQAERSKVWFKIDEKGYDKSKFDSSSDDDVDSQKNCWASTTMAQGSNYTFQIPTALKAGQYLLRHELIALHNAKNSWNGVIDSDATGSQHYMNCMQLDVQSDGTDFPANEYMVAFPGAYKKDDPGIKIDIWWPLPLAEDYQIPGPEVWTGGSDSSSGSGSDSGSGSASKSDNTDTAVTTTAEASASAPAAAETAGSDNTSTGDAEEYDTYKAAAGSEHKLKKCGVGKKRRMARR